MTGPLAAGELIGGRYRVERYIDEGGMQFVYAARDELAERLVALKTPKNKSATKRFHRGAVVAAKVNHPNVAKTLDYVIDGQERYLIEELIAGLDLDKALLRRSSFLDPYLAARVFHHLAKGIGAAHHAQVVHRDLKPTNIMVVGGYSLSEIKITDFGIAKLAGDEIDSAAEKGDMTLSKTAVGAVPYMAPESVMAEDAVGAPADIWSLGAMMYQLLCGVLPFGSGLRAVAKILEGPPPPPPAFLAANRQFSTLAGQLVDLALACMRRDPNDRPKADDLVRDCSALCYSVAQRREGVVKRVEHNAWGFIQTDAADVFFNQQSLYGPGKLEVGDHVLFSAYEGGGAARAHPVVKLVAPR